MEKEKNSVGRPKKEKNPEIGIRIEALRKDNNITQKKLAELVGVSRDSIRNWEHSRNEPNEDFAKKLSKYLRCDWKYILCIENDEVEDEDDFFVPKTLKDYTTDELLAEIKRRIEAS